NLAAFDQRQLREVAVVVHEQVKHEVADAIRLTARMLQEAKIRPSRIIERDDFPIYHSVCGSAAQSGEDVLVLTIERFAPPGIEAHLAIRIDGERTVSVKLNLVHPIPTGRQFADGETFHRFDEAGFATG